MATSLVESEKQVQISHLRTNTKIIKSVLLHFVAGCYLELRVYFAVKALVPLL